MIRTLTIASIALCCLIVLWCQPVDFEIYQPELTLDLRYHGVDAAEIGVDYIIAYKWDGEKYVEMWRRNCKN